MALEARTLTKTERNLWNAIVGEALAYLKYNAFAHRALEEGHPEVAQVFQEVAGAETIHGLNHLRVSGEIRTTVENLRAVTTGETKEFSTMYPRMIRDAVQEGRPEAADSFALALERERHHLEVFTRALEELEAKTPDVQAILESITPTLGTAPDATDETASPPQALPVPDMDAYISAAMEIDRERWRVASLGRLREVVFGAQDGILSTVALVTVVFTPIIPAIPQSMATSTDSCMSSTAKSGDSFTATGVSQAPCFTVFRIFSNSLPCCRSRSPGVFGDETFTTR